MNQTTAVEWLKFAKIDLDTLARIITDEHLPPSIYRIPFANGV
jgi:hypothetical protein